MARRARSRSAMRRRAASKSASRYRIAHARRDSMREIRTLIVDDEPVARAGLRKLPAAEPGIDVIGEAADGRRAVAAVRELRPDLLLLDVQMPGMNGFEVLDAIGPRAVPAIVFVTAYDQFAVRAFEIQALDYLLKPFDDERFTTVIGRVREHLR